MPMRNEVELPTNKVFCVTNIKTKKWFRVFSPEQLEEMVADGRINEAHRVTMMHSNSGLGGDRGVVSDGPKIRTVSYA